MTVGAMTKATLRTLFAGGGMLATWLAVTPNDGVPVSTSSATIDRIAVTRELTADELNAQANRLRDHLKAVPLRPTARNPFRFAEPAPAKRVRTGSDDSGPSAEAPTVIPPPPQPSFVLVGLTETKSPAGSRRTAVISGEGQLFLVAVGESVAGRYVVVTIEPGSAVLRDESGGEIRLVLP
jgi:hypothetical protein